MSNTAGKQDGEKQAGREPDHPEALTRIIPPDFYIDIVARVVPGGLVIFLWFQDKLPAANARDWITIPAVFVAAWLIGTTLETVTYTMPILFLDWLRKNSQPEAPLVKHFLNPAVGIKPTLKALYECNMFERHIQLRRMSENILLRLMLVISIATCVVKPDMFPSWYDWEWGALIATVFLICWGFKRRLYLYPPTEDQPGKI